MKIRAIFGILAVCFLSVPLFADMGAIVPTGNASIAEPSHKALVMYNGSEDILILGTDIVSSPAGPMVRFIPLPSKPAVSLAAKDVFEKLNALIKTKKLQYVLQTKGAAEQKPVTELVLSQKIGPHDITVIRVENAAGFLPMVKDFLKKKNLPSGGLDGKIESVAADYIKRGFRYFVFDVIYTTPEVKSVEAVQFRFASPKLYYPLKTSNLFGGKGAIDLIVAAPTARETYGLPLPYFMVSTTAVVQPKELAPFYPGSVSFFRKLKGRGPVLQAIRIEGEMKFDNDIWVDAMKGPLEIKPTTGF